MPVNQIRAFHRPDRIQQVWHLLAEGPQVRLVGGGTDLTIHCPAEVRVLVDLSHLGIGGISEEADGSIRVGAMATLSEVLEHPELRRRASGVIADMLVHVGSPLLRNAATVGGHLARGYLSDVVPVLLALDAEIELFDGETRRLPLDLYYHDGVHDTPHIVTAVIVPSFLDDAAAFLRFSRSGFDHALVNTACRVRLTDGVVSDARVAVGAGPGVAHLLPAASGGLVGSPLDDSVIARAAALAGGVETHSNWIASAEYRSHLAVTLVDRCLRMVRDRLEGGA
jgi:CO/xanthine dehydrogenase FAD-binding subunit